jgi:hypothetical protein
MYSKKPQKFKDVSKEKGKEKRVKKVIRARKMEKKNVTEHSTYI